ncbi:hypothetical protein BH24DEI2_BH24DEI2_17980 [soil metagenome]
MAKQFSTEEAEKQRDRASKLGETFEEQYQLLNYAVDASNNCIVVSDPNQDDNPLIYVNKGFENLTGYSFDESVGRNCRFLQNDNHDQPGLVQLRKAVKASQDAQVTLLNYRKDGTSFWNELYVSAIRDQGGDLIYFMGVQNDITRRVEQERNLKKAVKASLQDSSWLSRAIFEKLAQYAAGVHEGAHLADFTPREGEVLELLARGLSNVDIARELELSPNTVRNHLAKVYDKLGLRTRAKAARWARERGLG